MATNGTDYSDKYAASVTGTAEANSASGNNLSKDEVGWYFVEQYYTTLSKSPDKLHLFYSKKSQFVYGLEAEVTSVAVGRQDIQEHIHKLDFQDCKVRISNVDSQASLDNIVIQVIGETSNKSEEPKKFVQTFVLAQQPSGYFVLNDILRFIKEEDVEAADAATGAGSAEAAAPAGKPEPVAEVETPASSAAPSQAAAVETKPEEPVAAAVNNAVSAPVVPVPVESAKAVETPAPVAEAKTAEVAPVTEVKKTEAAKEPVAAAAAVTIPTRSAAPAAAPAPVKAEKPKEPARPMTWASRAAAAAGSARPPVALPKPAVPATGAAKPAAAPASAAAAAAAPAAKTSAESDASAPAATTGAKESGNEWQTAGSDSKRQNRPQSTSASTHEKDGRLGYVKNVTDKVEDATLRQHLETFGPLAYFEISRSKNCAFIEYASVAAQLSAVSANPHTVNGESILVEARHSRGGAFGGANYRNNRGGASGRGRGGFENRSGSQSGGRGGFTGQNRGRGGAGAGAARGRGASQVAA